MVGTDIALQLVIGFGKLLLSVILAVIAIFIGIAVFRNLIKERDIVEELKNKNTAIGVLVASLIVSIALLIQAGVFAVVNSIGPNINIVKLIGGLIALIIGVIFAVIIQFLGLKLYDKITKGIEELKEIEEGNVAVAILLAAILISLALVIGPGITGIAFSIAP